MPVITVNEVNFEDEVYQAQPVVVRFGKTNCSLCIELQQVLEKLAYEVKVVIVDVNESPDIAQHFGITSVPAIVFLSKDTPRSTWIGASSLQNLQKLLQKATEEIDDDIDSSWDNEFFNKLPYMRKPPVLISKAISSNVPPSVPVEQKALEIVSYVLLAFGLFGFAAVFYMAATSDSPPHTAASQGYDKPNDMSNELWSRTVRKFEREGGMNEMDAKKAARIVWEVNK